MTGTYATNVPQALRGLKVVEFTHMVMDPTCGMMLADLGAEVIKVEPIEGDRTRHLLGAGAGLFPLFTVLCRSGKRTRASSCARPTPRARARAALPDIQLRSVRLREEQTPPGISHGRLSNLRQGWRLGP